MSQIQDKLEAVKDAIYHLYCVEGKSLNYISNLFKLNRKVMTDVIKHKWNFEKKAVRQVSPRIRKELNRCKNLLLSYMENAPTKEFTPVFEKLEINGNLFRTLCDVDNELEEARIKFRNKPTLKEISKTKKKNRCASSFGEVNSDEIWMDILGYEGLYQVSNYARVLSLKDGLILSPNLNILHNRYEFHLYKEGKRKAHKRYRLVAYAFVANDSPKDKNTVNHLDGDSTNDLPENLEWASQGENNVHRNEILGKGKHTSYCKNGRFKCVVVDDIYTFKTIVAASRFLGVSETQLQRYLTGETPFNRKVELKY